VPPVVGRCLPDKAYRHALGPEVHVETYPGTKCVPGILSYWLTGSMNLRDARREGFFPAPGGDPWHEDPMLYDAERFEADARYRRNLANLNVVAFLMSNRDAHTAQFVLYRDPLHLFLVDNSRAFTVPGNPEMRSRQDLSELVVPSIPRDTAARVDALTRADLERLARMEEYERSDETLRRLAPGDPIGDARQRIRSKGARVQVGLNDADLAGVIERARRLQRALREGAIDTFD
jgi:hypothetical protein